MSRHCHQNELWPNADLSTASSADFPVRTSALPVGATGSRAAAADSGLTCCASSPEYDRIGSLLRTSLLSVLEGWTSSCMVWSKQVTPAGRLWWVLGRSALPTTGIGCGSSESAFQTPTTQPHCQNSYPSDPSRKRPSLAEEAQWTTPNAWDADRGAESEETKAARGAGGVNLLEQVKQQWQTPNASLADAGTRSRSGKRKGELLLAGQAKESWPTPRAEDCEPRSLNGNQSRRRGAAVPAGLITRRSLVRIQPPLFTLAVASPFHLQAAARTNGRLAFFSHRQFIDNCRHEIHLTN